MAKTIQITNGPGKLAMASSLLEGQQVTFSLKGMQGLNALLTSIEMEDGSRDSWNLRLVIMNYHPFIEDDDVETAFYSTRTRQGTITLK